MFRSVPSQPELPPEIEMQIRRLLRDEHLQGGKVASAAKVIFGWFPPGNSLDEGILQWGRILQMLYLRTPKGDSLQEQRTAEACKGLQLSLTNLYSAHLEASTAGLQRIAYVCKAGQDADSSKPGMRFLQAMSQQLLYSYGIRVRTIETLKEYFTEERLSLLGEWGDVEPGEVEELAANLERLRAYGVKPCIFEDGLLHPSSHSWIFNDGHEFIRGLDPEKKHGLEQPIAVTHLALKSTINRIRPVTYRDGTPYRRLSHGFEPYMAVAIKNGGVMTMDVEQGLIPTEGIFREASLDSVYPQFQLVHLLRLFELVVPEEVTRGMPAWPSLPSTRKGREELQAKTPRMWRSLVLPRQRILREPGLLEALEREIVEGLELTNRLSQPQSDPREIIGFLRRLPKGHKASPSARELAWKEQTLQIPDGYTYVKTQGDGPVEEIIHRVQSRRSRS